MDGGSAECTREREEKKDKHTEVLIRSVMIPVNIFVVNTHSKSDDSDARNWQRMDAQVNAAPNARKKISKNAKKNQELKNGAKDHIRGSRGILLPLSCSDCSVDCCSPKSESVCGTRTKGRKNVAVKA